MGLSRSSQIVLALNQLGLWISLLRLLPPVVCWTFPSGLMASEVFEIKAEEDGMADIYIMCTGLVGVIP